MPLAAIKMSNLDNFRWWAWTWDGCVLFIQCKRNQRKLNWVREIYIPVEQVKAWNSNKEMFSNGEDDAWWQWLTSNSNLKSWVVTIVIQIKTNWLGNFNGKIWSGIFTSTLLVKSFRNFAQNHITWHVQQTMHVLHVLAGHQPLGPQLNSGFSLLLLIRKLKHL